MLIKSNSMVEQSSVKIKIWSPSWMNFRELNIWSPTLKLIIDWKMSK